MARADAARQTSALVRKAPAETTVGQQVRDALAQADIARITAARVREALAKAGMSDTH